MKYFTKEASWARTEEAIKHITASRPSFIRDIRGTVTKRNNLEAMGFDNLTIREAEILGEARAKILRTDDTVTAVGTYLNDSKRLKAEAELNKLYDQLNSGGKSSEPIRYFTKKALKIPTKRAYTRYAARPRVTNNRPLSYKELEKLKWELGAKVDTQEIGQMVYGSAPKVIK